MENRVTDQPAFILHRRDYQDSSLILDLFTRDYGRLSLVARSARKRKAVAHFQVGNRLSVGWSGRGELKTLTQIDSKNLSIPADCYLAMFYLNELLLYLLPKHDEHASLFHHYQKLLLQLGHEPLEPLLRDFEMDLLLDLGFMPDLSCISASGQALQTEQYYQLDCRNGISEADTDTKVAYRGNDLLALQQRRFDQPEVLRIAKSLLRQIIDFNLQGRTLQSRQLYQQLKTKS